MAFADLAPLADSLGITETQANNYFDNLPDPPAAPTLPKITKAKYVAVANKVFDGFNGIENNGGILQIAKDVGLTFNQVKKIVNELNQLKAAYDAAQNNA